ncbi:glycosyltransferase family 4 protein [Spirosoma flavum]|uniref:Glycosyltransferase family 4 protein n=1 Tax=Spirosoma flavum TaxID=2048557 RepID=A0ABW6AE67_9BACT
MTVFYLFRSTGTGHSIEELFGNILCEIGQQGVTTKAVQLPHISRGLRSVWKNIQFVKRLTADIFHLTGDSHYVALALPASRTILTIHDCSLLKKNRNQPLQYVLFWLLWYYLPIRRAGIVTVVSEKTRQELLLYVGRIAQKVQVIPNGYDPVFINSPKSFCQDHPMLLQVGTAPHKNLSRLIAAIEGIPCTLVIVGPLTDKTLVDLQRRQISYQSYANLSRAEVVQLYIDCDIVTFVSTYEGFGMPILEANAVGRAIITSDISPMREIAAGAAHLVDPTDRAAIRQGILRLLQDDTYRQSLIEVSLKNAQQYTIAIAADRYKGLYQKLVPIHPSTQPVL